MESASYLSPHGIDLNRWSSALGNQNQGHLKRGFPLSEVTLSEVFLVIQRGLVVGTNTLIDLIRGVILNGSDVIRGVLYRPVSLLLSPSFDVYPNNRENAFFLIVL